MVNQMDRTYRRRMARQLPILGERGQQRIADTRLTIVGSGGTGTRFLEFSALAGFRKILVIDRQSKVELSNLNRLALCRQTDEGRPKAVVGKQRLEERLADVEVRAVVGDVRWRAVWEQAKQADWVIDSGDSQVTTRWLSRKCAEDGVSAIGMGLGFEFQRGRLVRAGCRANRVGPGDPCLECQTIVRGQPAARARAALVTLNAIVAGLGVDLLLRQLTKYGDRASLDEQGIDRDGTNDGQLAARDVNLLYFDLLNWTLAAERLLPTPECETCQLLASRAK